MLFFVVESGANQRWAKFLSGAGRVGEGGSAAVAVAVAAVAVAIEDSSPFHKKWARDSLSPAVISGP